MTYGYYAEIEECERQITLYVYETEDIDYNQAKRLQKLFDVKDIIKRYDECKSWSMAIRDYTVEHKIDVDDLR